MSNTTIQEHKDEDIDDNIGNISEQLIKKIKRIQGYKRGKNYIFYINCCKKCFENFKEVMRFCNINSGYIDLTSDTKEKLIYMIRSKFQLLIIRNDDETNFEWAIKDYFKQIEIELPSTKSDYRIKVINFCYMNTPYCCIRNAIGINNLTINETCMFFDVKKIKDIEEHQRFIIQHLSDQANSQEIRRIMNYKVNVGFHEILNPESAANYTALLKQCEEDSFSVVYYSKDSLSKYFTLIKIAHETEKRISKLELESLLIA